MRGSKYLACSRTLCASAGSAFGGAATPLHRLQQQRRGPPGPGGPSPGPPGGPPPGPPPGPPGGGPKTTGGPRASIMAAPASWRGARKPGAPLEEPEARSLIGALGPEAAGLRLRISTLRAAARRLRAACARMRAETRRCARAHSGLCACARRTRPQACVHAGAGAACMAPSVHGVRAARDGSARSRARAGASERAPPSPTPLTMT